MALGPDQTQAGGVGIGGVPDGQGAPEAPRQLLGFGDLGQGRLRIPRIKGGQSFNDQALVGVEPCARSLCIGSLRRRLTVGRQVQAQGLQPVGCRLALLLQSTGAILGNPLLTECPRGAQAFGVVLVALLDQAAHARGHSREGAGRAPESAQVHRLDHEGAVIGQERRVDGRAIEKRQDDEADLEQGALAELFEDQIPVVLGVDLGLERAIGGRGGRLTHGGCAGPRGSR